MRLNLSGLTAARYEASAIEIDLDRSGRDPRVAGCDLPHESQGHSQAIEAPALSCGETDMTVETTLKPVCAPLEANELATDTRSENRSGHKNTGHSGLSGHTQCLCGHPHKRRGLISGLSGLSCRERLQDNTARQTGERAYDFSGWALERCVWRERAWGGLGILYRDFSHWCLVRSIGSPSRAQLERALDKQGFTLDRNRGLCTGLLLRDGLWGFPAPASPSPSVTPQRTYSLPAVPKRPPAPDHLHQPELPLDGS
jgi:hypothetical protein